MITGLIKNETDYDAIGVGTTGQVNAETGGTLSTRTAIFPVTREQIKKELTGLFDVPVMVENDVNSAAMGEASYGAGKDYDSFLCLTYGTGVGGAIIQNGALFHGSSFSAGEFGGIVTHGTVKLSGADVFDGCYERFASTTALVHSAQKLDASLSNGRLIFERLAEPSVKKLVDDWIDEILLGLSTIIHISTLPASCSAAG